MAMLIACEALVDLSVQRQSNGYAMRAERDELKWVIDCQAIRRAGVYAGPI